MQEFLRPWCVRLYRSALPAKKSKKVELRSNLACLKAAAMGDTGTSLYMKLY